MSRQRSMENAPNREQQLFLVTGGIILVLILVVVVFDLVRSPKEPESVDITRPVVKLPAPPEGTAPKKARGETRWITTVSPAPIFANTDNDQAAPTGMDQNQAPEPDTSATDTTAKSRSTTSPPAHKVTVGDEDIAMPARTTMGSATATPTVTKPIVSPKTTSKAKTRATTTTSKIASTIKNATRTPSRVTTPTTSQTTSSATVPTASSSRKSGYSVQLASFSNESNAAALHAQIANLRFNNQRLPVYRQTVSVGGKNYYRVRVGPFASKKEAEQASVLVRSKAAITGSVVANR
ncbi:MAG: SPOR domain-containing protein [Magnetococcales bacterium]|nr:SPOR domain-containing protein [Magnetococcales bacterium]